MVTLLSAAALTAPASASAAGSISGEVTDAGTHGPIPGVRVCAVKYDLHEEVEEFCTHSELDGGYSILSLPAGEYTVEFLSGIEGLNYVYQVWAGKRVPYLADPVEVSSGDVPGIDAELAEGGRIGGRVVSASSGAPLADVEVCAEPGGLENVTGCAVTDALGEYTIVGLGSETYWVRFFPPEDTEFLEQYYDHQPGILEADDVEVTAGDLTPNVDAELQEAGQITGTIVDARTHAPLEGVDACAWEAVGSGYLGPCGESDASGHYKIRRVPAGVYHVSFNQFFHAPAYAIQWYQCANGPPATPVSVTAGLATSGIDAGLSEQWSSPCESEPAATPPPLVPTKVTALLRCRKGFRRKESKGRVRCVRKKKRHHRHHRHRHQVKPGRGR